MSNPINSGVGQWDKNADLELEWRLKQMRDDMKLVWARLDELEQYRMLDRSRLDELERNRDENSEPYEAMESFKDAGEPVDRYIDPYFRSVIEENAKLIEENDVLRYQYEAMREEIARCKELLAKKNQEIDVLNHRIEFFEKMAHDLELEKNDAKWYREQAIKKCIDIVELIKNDTLTVGEGKRWMVAICEDIQRAIKNEFGVK